WLLGTGPTTGLAFIPTNNKDPYNSPCTPGPDLWSAALLALNETTGNIVWGFQANAHDVWDYDCSWWQALGNETVGGTTTQVIWKTCKAGYLFEINAKTGALIWAWTAPQSTEPRCANCYMLDPLNSTQMDEPYFNPARLAPSEGTVMNPTALGAFENEGSYSPALNYVFVDEENVPGLVYYVPPNDTNYRTNSGLAFFPITGKSLYDHVNDNNTLFAINAATGQMVWTYYVPTTGFRGGVTNSGNVVYLTLSSGDLLMVNATNGKQIKDLFIGGPLNVLPSVGATEGGQMELILPITAGLETWAPSGVPGDLVALTLQAPSGLTTGVTTSTTTVTASGSGAGTVTVTSTSISTVNSGGGATVYALAAVSVIFIIATGYLAMTRG
ncbi:MAG TPA: PQQ-binding-like beta-propeller repeat protein, partial [Nitrososphaerales archaeon]|nr:PQQ-binding-like beta-propeller repeat protein [Nitrososphaerales archaeon]